LQADLFKDDICECLEIPFLEEIFPSKFYSQANLALGNMLKIADLLDSLITDLVTLNKLHRIVHIDGLAHGDVAPCFLPLIGKLLKLNVKRLPT
jgi:hypothetical protein